MELSTQVKGSVTVVTLSGELDAQTSREAQAAIVPLCQQESNLLLDMSAVSYMSSMGLQLILLLYHQMMRVQGRMALVGLSENLKNTLSTMGFLSYLTTYETLDEGLASLPS